MELLLPQMPPAFKPAYRPFQIGVGAGAGGAFLVARSAAKAEPSEETRIIAVVAASFVFIACVLTCVVLSLRLRKSHYLFTRTLFCRGYCSFMTK
jgi:hypothetical protein